MIDIKFYNQTRLNLENEIKKLKQHFSKLEDRVSFSVIFTKENKMKSLNKKYRNIDEVTDVLSFPSGEVDYLGDIFICPKKAFKQAKIYQHSKLRELGFLIVHGYLHLLGFDHQEQKDEKTMFAKQDQILSLIGLERK